MIRAAFAMLICGIACAITYAWLVVWLSVKIGVCR